MKTLIVVIIFLCLYAQILASEPNKKTSKVHIPSYIEEDEYGGYKFKNVNNDEHGKQQIDDYKDSRYRKHDTHEEFEFRNPKKHDSKENKWNLSKESEESESSDYSSNENEWWKHGKPEKFDNKKSKGPKKFNNQDSDMSKFHNSKEFNSHRSSSSKSEESKSKPFKPTKEVPTKIYTPWNSDESNSTAVTVTESVSLNESTSYSGTEKSNPPVSKRPNKSKEFVDSKSWEFHQPNHPDKFNSKKPYWHDDRESEDSKSRESLQHRSKEFHKPYQYKTSHSRESHSFEHKRHDFSWSSESDEFRSKEFNKHEKFSSDESNFHKPKQPQNEKSKETKSKEMVSKKPHEHFSKESIKTTPISESESSVTFSGETTELDIYTGWDSEESSSTAATVTESIGLNESTSYSQTRKWNRPASKRPNKPKESWEFHQLNHPDRFPPKKPYWQDHRRSEESERYRSKEFDKRHKHLRESHSSEHKHHDLSWSSESDEFRSKEFNKHEKFSSDESKFHKPKPPHNSKPTKNEKSKETKSKEMVSKKPHEHFSKESIKTTPISVTEASVSSSDETTEFDIYTGWDSEESSSTAATVTESIGLNASTSYSQTRKWNRPATKRPNKPKESWEFHQPKYPDRFPPKKPYWHDHRRSEESERYRSKEFNKHHKNSRESHSFEHKHHDLSRSSESDEFRSKEFDKHNKHPKFSSEESDWHKPQRPHESKPKHNENHHPHHKHSHEKKSKEFNSNEETTTIFDKTEDFSEQPTETGEEVTETEYYTSSDSDEFTGTEPTTTDHSTSNKPQTSTKKPKEHKSHEHHGSKEFDKPKHKYPKHPKEHSRESGSMSNESKDFRSHESRSKENGKPKHKHHKSKEFDSRSSEGSKEWWSKESRESRSRESHGSRSSESKEFPKHHPSKESREHGHSKEIPDCNHAKTEEIFSGESHESNPIKESFRIGFKIREIHGKLLERIAAHEDEFKFSMEGAVESLAKEMKELYQLASDTQEEAKESDVDITRCHKYIKHRQFVSSFDKCVNKKQVAFIQFQQKSLVDIEKEFGKGRENCHFKENLFHLDINQCLQELLVNTKIKIFKIEKAIEIMLTMDRVHRLGCIDSTFMALDCDINRDAKRFNKCVEDIMDKEVYLR